MSIINDMLKEIKPKPTQRNAIPAALVIQPNHQLPWLRISLVTLIAIGLGSTAAVFYLKHSQKSSAMALSQATVNRQETAKVDRVETIDYNELSLAGVTKHENIMQISFLMTQPATLKQQITKQHLVIYLNKTNVVGKLASELKKSTTLKHVSVSNENQQTRIDLQFNPNINVHPARLTNHNNQYHLIIEASEVLPHKAVKQTNLSQINAETETAIKTPVIEPLAEKDYQLALQLINQGNRLQAKKLLTSSLKLAPNFAAARSALIAMMIQDKNYANAVRLADKGMLLDAENITFYQLKGHALLKMGQLQAALNTLQQQAPEISDHADYYGLLAAVLTRLHDYKDAITVYAQLANTFPDHGQWWIALAQALEKSSQGAAALQAYHKALTSHDLAKATRQSLQEHLLQLQEGDYANG